MTTSSSRPRVAEGTAGPDDPAEEARREADDLRRLVAEAERFIVHLRSQVEDRDRRLARERRHALEAHTLAATQADEFRRVIDGLIAGRDEARRRVAELEPALAEATTERDALAARLAEATAPRPGLPRRAARRLRRMLGRTAG